jgi:hypothetical protein
MPRIGRAVAPGYPHHVIQRERSNYGLLPDEQPHPSVDKAALRGIVVQDEVGIKGSHLDIGHNVEDQFMCDKQIGTHPILFGINIAYNA